MKYFVNQFAKRTAQLSVGFYNRWLSHLTNTYLRPIPMIDEPFSIETNRHWLSVFPKSSGTLNLIQAIEHDYRVVGSTLLYTVRLSKLPFGMLTLSLRMMAFNGERLLYEWMTEIQRTQETKIHSNALEISVDSTSGTAQVDGRAMRPVGDFDNFSLPGKFIVEFSLMTEGLCVETNRFSQYFAKSLGVADQGYFQGDVYDNYETVTYLDSFLTQVQQHKNGGRLLDVGCATGVFMRKAQDAGFDVYGCDSSEYAVRKASERIGDTDRVVQCDIDSEIIPFDMKFDCITAIAVIEHLNDPKSAIQKLAFLLKADGIMLIHTANANSLTHSVFGSDWEGYADYTHRSVDTLTTEFMRNIFHEDDFVILQLQTEGIWRRPYDAETAVLRSLYDHVPSFREWIEISDRGDFINCIVKRASIGKHKQ